MGTTATGEPVMQSIGSLNVNPFSPAGRAAMRTFAQNNSALGTAKALEWPVYGTASTPTDANGVPQVERLMMPYVYRGSEPSQVIKDQARLTPQRIDEARNELQTLTSIKESRQLTPEQTEMVEARIAEDMQLLEEALYMNEAWKGYGFDRYYK